MESVVRSFVLWFDLSIFYELVEVHIIKTTKIGQDTAQDTALACVIR